MGMNGFLYSPLRYHTILDAPSIGNVNDSRSAASITPGNRPGPGWSPKSILFGVLGI